MNCEDLISIRQIRQGMKLRAGEVGLHRHIRWIYFADCALGLTEDYNLMEYIYGEELVIITNQEITDDEDRILDMIKRMIQKNIAGIVINEGQILEGVKRFCDENELPLFELSFKLPLNDFTHIVFSALVEEESNENSKERILSTILYSSELNMEEVQEQADYLGVNLYDRQSVIVFKIDEKRGNNKNDVGKSLDLHQSIQKLIKSEFSSFGLPRFLMLWQVNKSVVLFPTGFFSRDLLTSIIENIINGIENRFHIKVCAGIGNSYEYIKDLKKSYVEAKSALEISERINHAKISFYSDLGIYSLIAQVTNEKYLDEYVEGKLGELIRYDKMNEGELLGTLEVYLECECNAKLAAEQLFIHRNTMRYRMDKIKKVLNIELATMSEFMELKLAFAILKFQKN